MAKDVDLSSRQWTDIVFEGKNKEFGAYVMRRKSDGRHNRAFLYVLLALALILGIAFYLSHQKKKKELEDKEAQIAMQQLEQEMMIMELPEEEEMEEEEEEEEVRYEEPEQPEAIPEEILNTMMQTEITIKADEEVVEEVKTQEELQSSETAIGNVDFSDGTDDLNVVRQYQEEVIVEEKKPEPPANKVFEAVEQMPTFPGGDAELMKYLNKHIVYPTLAAENGIQGQVVVKFVVKADGSIGDVIVVRSKDPDLDREAVRVVKSLPNFIPGRMNGQAVSVWFTLPVRFRLQN